MAIFRVLTEKLAGLTGLIRPQQRWLIVINADPDAIGSAMALRQIIRSRGGQADIAHINEVSRPDNLTMIHSLRIPLARLTPGMTGLYQRFAMVDSQPHHCVEFPQLDYDVILDHHPLDPRNPVKAKYVEIRPDYGSCSALLTEYLYNLGIVPGKLLATALLYAIKTDTMTFERQFSETDVKAFSYLSKYADKMRLRRIVHSDFHRRWLKFFSRAFTRGRYIGREGFFAYVGRVDNPDVLVVLADFFLRVHGLSWDCIGGQYGDKLVAVMRSDGLRRNMGKKAQAWFGEFGSAGGHMMAARAEMELSRLEGRDLETFLLSRLTGRLASSSVAHPRGGKERAPHPAHPEHAARPEPGAEKSA